MPLPVTSMLAGLFALMMVPLSLQVSMRRIELGRSPPGPGRDETLHRRIRAHGNFTEYVPTAILVVGLCEYSGAGRVFVAGMAAAFLSSRVLHAIGMLYTRTPALRGAGMLVQHAAFLVSGAWLVLHVVA